MSAREREDGAVLLTTLLVMSLIATLAVSIMEDVSYAIQRASVLEDAAQADAYLDGAEGFVTAQLEQTVASVPPEQLNTLFAEPQVFTLPIEDGILSLTVSDGTHCVSPTDVQFAGAERRFTRTLVQIGVPRNEAAVMTASLIDWQDGDPQQQPLGGEDGAYLLLDPPYRTPDSAVTSITELRAVQGFTHEVWEAVAPWMCIEPLEAVRINVNTLPEREAGLLAATLGKDLGFAEGLLRDRPAGGWDEIAFLELPGIVPDPDADEPSIENLELLTFLPDRLRVDIRVAYRETVRRAALRVDMSGGTPVVIHRMRGETALPRLKFAPEDARPGLPGFLTGDGNG